MQYQAGRREAVVHKGRRVQQRSGVAGGDGVCQCWKSVCVCMCVCVCVRECVCVGSADESMIHPNTVPLSLFLLLLPPPPLPPTQICPCTTPLQAYRSSGVRGRTKHSRGSGLCASPRAPQRCAEHLAARFCSRRIHPHRGERLVVCLVDPIGQEG